MIEDTPNDNKKCGVQGSLTRVFKFRKSDAQELKCRTECILRENCVAMSGVFSASKSWCIGCNVALDMPHSKAKAFKKEGKCLYRPESIEH